jgi:hypothetical protein
LFPLTSVFAVGNVPNSSYSSEELSAETIDDARDYCDSLTSCSGLSYRPNDADDEHPWTVHIHSFLPPLLNQTNDTAESNDWITERSSKDFVFRRGKLVVNESQALDLNVNDVSSLTLSGVQELCTNHSECVAFSFPTKAAGLDGFAEIVFSSDVKRLEGDEDDWQTFVVNDISKAEKVNPNVLQYDERLERKPYSTCCDSYSSIQESVELPTIEDVQRVNTLPSQESFKLPTIEEVQRVDTLPRIPCNISKEEFQEKYEFTRTPVMLVGCNDDWPARKEWTIEKLTRRFGEDDTKMWKTKWNGSGFHEISWEELMEEVGQGNSVYLFDELDSPGQLSMKNDYETPPQFQGSDMYPQGTFQLLVLRESFSCN